MSDPEVIAFPNRLKNWTVVAVLHTIPNNDLIEHRLGQECTCRPVAEAVSQPGATKGILVKHKALDGRTAYE